MFSVLATHFYKRLILLSKINPNGRTGDLTKDKWADSPPPRSLFSFNDLFAPLNSLFLLRIWRFRPPICVNKLHYFRGKKKLKHPTKGILIFLIQFVVYISMQFNDLFFIHPRLKTEHKHRISKIFPKNHAIA